MWTENFITVLKAVAEIGLIIYISGLLIRKKFVPEAGIKVISSLVVSLFLPCLIFSNIIRKFDPSSMPNWWVIPIVAIAMALISWPIAWLIHRRGGTENRELIPLSFLQNAGFIVLPIVKAILPVGFDEFAILVFLFIMAQNPMLWVIGKYYMSKHVANEAFHWKRLISPPLCASLAAIFLSLTELRTWIPDLVVDTSAFFGEAAIPLATFVLGATLGGLKCNFKSHLKAAISVNLFKLGLVPLLMLGAMVLIPWLTSSDHFALLFALQAVAPPATTLLLQSQTYNDNSERVAAILLFSYCAGLFVIPVWVTIVQSLFR